MVEVETLAAHVHNVVIKVDTGRAPHYHLRWVKLLEVSSRSHGYCTARFFIAALEVLDATAIRLASHSSEADAHKFEYVGDGANQVGGAQNIAAQVKDNI